MLLTLEEYARRMAGNWERMSGFAFFWTDTFDFYAKAQDIAYITLANDQQSPMVLQANAEAIEKVIEAFAAETAVESTEFPEEDFPPLEWYRFENGKFHEIKLKNLYIRVYYPGTKQITSTFAKLYELLAQAKQFVYDPDLPDESIEILDQEIYDRYVREERFLGISNAAFWHFHLSLTGEQIADIYIWLESHHCEFEIDEEHGYFYPSPELLGQAFAGLPVKVDVEVVP